MEVRLPGEVDERRWEEIGALMVEATERVEAIMIASARRLRESARPGSEVLCALLLLESSPWESCGEATHGPRPSQWEARVSVRFPGDSGSALRRPQRLSVLRPRYVRPCRSAGAPPPSEIRFHGSDSRPGLTALPESSENPCSETRTHRGRIGSRSHDFPDGKLERIRVSFCRRTASTAVASPPMQNRTPTRPMPRRPRVSEEFVELHRRRRYVDAAAEILHEFGRSGLTTTNLVRLAGGSRSSFYQAFDGVEGCMAYGFGIAEEELFAERGDASGEKSRLTEVYEAIGGFFGAVAAAPLHAEFFLIHSAAVRTEEGRVAFGVGGESFAALIGRGHLEAEMLDRRPPPALAAECLSRAIVELAARRSGVRRRRPWPRRVRA
jgi:AcrR family transcriptional regulator